MADHWGFVAAAYGVATVVILAMILATLADYRAQRAALRRVEDADGRGAGT
ncbi:MAG: heme exporter protein CcmD [Roseiarcus sp.]|jgi:heme exporter protein CcmD